MKNEVLSINRFKDPNGDLVDPTTLPNKDFNAFHTAKLMKSVIEVLEVSIHNDRIFNRAKFDVMAKFHDFFGALDTRYTADEV